MAKDKAPDADASSAPNNVTGRESTATLSQDMLKLRPIERVGGIRNWARSKIYKALSWLGIVGASAGVGHMAGKAVATSVGKPMEKMQNEIRPEWCKQPPENFKQMLTKQWEGSIGKLLNGMLEKMDIQIYVQRFLDAAIRQLNDMQARVYEICGKLTDVVAATKKLVMETTYWMTNAFVMMTTFILLKRLYQTLRKNLPTDEQRRLDQALQAAQVNFERVQGAYSNMVIVMNQHAKTADEQAAQIASLSAALGEANKKLADLTADTVNIGKSLSIDPQTALDQKQNPDMSISAAAKEAGEIVVRPATFVTSKPDTSVSAAPATFEPDSPSPSYDPESLSKDQ